jgi:Protein of unknown function (DUF2490)
VTVAAIRSHSARPRNVMKSTFSTISARGWLCSVWSAVSSYVQATVTLRTVLAFTVTALWLFLLSIPAHAQPIPPNQDPEDERKLGLWIDQALSYSLSADKSLEIGFEQRLDEQVTNLFVYFFQAGVAFRVRPWLLVKPFYRYMRYPGDTTTSYENRLLLDVTLSRPRGRLRPTFRMRTEGRIPENRIASLRLRLRPGIEYTLPLRMKRPPVAVVNNEFFVVPGADSFSSASKFTQDRLLAGVSLPVTDYFSIRPYYLRQWVNPPSGWDNNGVIGISLSLKVDGLIQRFH